MKKYSIFIVLSLALGILLAACEKNEVLPDYELIGTSTATIASISLPNDTLAPGEQVTVTLSYVNLAEDPARSIQLLAKVGDADFIEITTLDEAASPANEEVTRTYTYTVPNVADKTAINLDMLLNSQKQFPQRERTSFVVMAP